MPLTSLSRSTLAALAVGVLLPLGLAGCGSADARGGAGTLSSSPVGKVLDATDGTGRHLREVDKDRAPQVGVEVTPDAAGGWDVLLTLRGFRLSPAGTRAKAVAGHGLVRLFVDGRPVTRMRTPGYHLSDGLLPHGTHQVTARLYADDGTVWAVQGEPVESTADITASAAQGPSYASPSAGTTSPSVGTTSPSVGTATPEAGTAPPGTGTPTPKAGTVTPEAGTVTLTVSP
ncbi:hypothetical protein ACGFYV_00180 [Streptomyces sp. NPDC048297]|uniref:hypothetical protein n=1 Tax=Streptomyces sp. NPDC048297 TaxID=3365531 RepID=UPI0037174E61